MRLPRLASIAMAAALVLLTGCSSNNAPKRPASSSITAPSSVSSTSSTVPRTSSSTSTTQPPTTISPTEAPPTSVPVSALGGPRVIRLTGPATPVQCNAPTSVELRWETRGARTVTLRIDAGPVFATYRDGANDKLVPLTCDGNAHRYTITARAADGRIARRTLTITEHAR